MIIQLDQNKYKLLRLIVNIKVSSNLHICACGSLNPRAATTAYSK